jgi:predicted HicB family RNase H-like nuclease
MIMAEKATRKNIKQENRANVVIMRVQTDLKAKLFKAAEQAGESANKFIVGLIKVGLSRRQAIEKSKKNGK